ncbi:MAG: hypothetical protein ACPGUX_08540 [Halocynthiibacter sp.]
MKIVQRFLTAVLMMSAVTACAKIDPTSEPVREMGQFKLGHNVVVAENAQPGPLTRSTNAEELEKALTTAMDERLGQYDGDRLIHIGIAVDGYVLALPGVPLVLSPKSVLALTVNVWDNETQEKLNAEPRRFAVFERGAAETVVGSGLTQNKAAQLENLSRNAALKIQNWILENPEWIGLTAEDSSAEDAAQ